MVSHACQAVIGNERKDVRIRPPSRKGAGAEWGPAGHTDSQINRLAQYSEPSNRACRRFV